MVQTQSDNKKIAKNTIYLYIRMFATMAVGLFTSRVVLDVLGVEDFGIYGLVGGIMVLFSFVEYALTASTQRFLNFFMGRNDIAKVNTVFSMSVTIYIMFSAVFVVLAETIGLWFLNTCLNIPSERMWAAQWVYQLTIVQFVLNIMRVPYNSSIIAYEKMSFYAYTSIIDVVAKLAAVYLLYITCFDRLITYAVLFTLIPVIFLLVYKIYCNRSFSTTRYNPRDWQKDLFRQILGFSGWDITYIASNVFSTQGLNIILNIFHGVTLNAAANVASNASAHVNNFVRNFQIAFRPQIIKTYAAEQTDEFHTLVFRASKFSYFLMLILMIPLLFSLDKILAIWLVEVPVYAKEFCQLTLIFMAIDAFYGPYQYAVNATGKIRRQRLITSILKILSLPIGFVALKWGLSPSSIWYAQILTNVMCMVYTLSYVTRYIDFKMSSVLRLTCVPAIIVTLLSIPVPYLLRELIDGFWANLLAVCIGSLIVTSLLVLYIGMTAHERAAIFRILRGKLGRKTE